MSSQTIKQSDSQGRPDYIQDYISGCFTRLKISNLFDRHFRQHQTDSLYNNFIKRVWQTAHKSTVHGSSGFMSSMGGIQRAQWGKPRLCLHGWQVWSVLKDGRLVRVSNLFGVVARRYEARERMDNLSVSIPANLYPCGEPAGYVLKG